jgi:endonuclease/exonuclease/phosphatase family metal-dependent hydrolase
MQQFRIATYNIHKAVGMDQRASVSRIARVLGELQPDIVALQEVVSHEGRNHEDHQAEYHGGIYGNVTLSRWPIETSRHIDMTVPSREERGALRTDVRIGGQLVHVFNLHLGTAYGERRRQAERLLEQDLLRALDISGPRIVLGDFNEWTRGLVTRTLAAEFHLTDLRPHLKRRRTYPALFPVLHLDNIYFDHHVAVSHAWFHASRLSFVASDHLPLAADMTLKLGEPSP